MEHDEHEMLIEYSEMTTFNFHSQEYQEVRRDYKECKNAVSGIIMFLSGMLNKFRLTKAY